MLDLSRWFNPNRREFERQFALPIVVPNHFVTASADSAIESNSGRQVQLRRSIFLCN